MQRGMLFFFWALAATGCAAGPVGLLREAAGASSQNLCSSVFVSGLDPEVVFREHLRPEPGMGLVAWALDYEVDRTRAEVRTRIAGGFERRSVFRAGRGCTLLYPGLEPPAPISAPAPQLEPAAVSGNGLLAAELAAEFADPQRATKALVVMHRGQLIAERYAPGYDANTRVNGHSLAKSLVNALVGILVRQGKLSVDQRAPIAAWAHDPLRAHITIDQLLRMNAGFGFDEGSGASLATHIWYNLPDTAAAAAAAEIVSKDWGYSSRSYALLARIVADAVGGGPQRLRDFAERELFTPLGMRNVTIEFDQAGTMMGAHAVFASARDWARLGELYRNDGVAGQTRILPQGWVAYSTRPTPGTGYGAGFWLNNTRAPMPEWGMRWGLPGVPSDAFMGRGYLGQYLVVVPSAELVVMRAGVSNARNANLEGFGRFVHDVMDTLAHAPQARSAP